MLDDIGNRPSPLVKSQPNLAIPRTTSCEHGPAGEAYSGCLVQHAKSFIIDRAGDPGRARPAG
jgi:hypothetical protein